MAELNQQELYKTQISQTEWLKAMCHAEAEAFRIEDNDKRERLKRLNELTGLPYDRAYEFQATEVADRSPKFQAFLDEHADELWAVRLVPSDPTLPKLRMRGGTLRETLEWIDQQDFDRSSYRADFSAHANEQTWATIFVVNDGGAFGEIIRGPHAQLTQGFYEDAPPFRFGWDGFKTLSLTPYDGAAEAEVRSMLGWLRVADDSTRRQLEQELAAKFTNDYLHGYFEANNSPQFGFRFIDYNRVLGRLYQDFKNQTAPAGTSLVSGQAGSPGKARGKVRVIDGVQPPALQPGEILVCRMTTPDYLPLMQQAAAIVTDLGGILSHAAIVARELGKPCLTATRTATQTLRTGMLVEVDADTGVVRAI